MKQAKHCQRRSIYTLASITIIGFAVSGCLNQGSSTSGKTSTSTSSPTNSTTTTTIANRKFTIASASAAADTTSSGKPPTFTLIMNANNTTNTLNDFCKVQTGTKDPSKACKCRFKWAENNIANSKVIQRTIDTEPSQILSFQVQCPAPTVYDSEIADNTFVKISYIPDLAAGNSSGFTTNELSFKKQPITASGDFRDAEGRSFRNVYHYTCFDKFQKALSISHKVVAGPTNESTGVAPLLPLANDFTLGGGLTSNYSAQSYYYDFYIRSNEVGSINAGNSSFTCPQVNIGGVPSFFPLDSQFAVALQKTADYSVAVTSGNIVVPVSTDPSGASGSVLGYAAKPNADGTCPAFTDSAGRIRRTFRLRRFKALYPLRYGADGDVADRSQPVNTVYIMDRPVDKVGQDPLKPLTRLGPKPCPFSFKTAQFGQKCSTDASLRGWNIDGTQVNGDPKCPVYPPPPSQFVKSDGTLVIRPYRPFLPHYLEDSNFKACAFQSSTPIDPEVVLSYDRTVFSAANGPHNFYCAKHYPPSGAIIPPPNGDPFDKPPGDCDLGSYGSAIKTNKTYACSRTYDPTNSSRNTPSAGCCQICSGSDCRAQGGGITASGRNAAFSPPSDAGNPPQSLKLLPRAIPNRTGGGGCFDPFED